MSTIFDPCPDWRLRYQRALFVCACLANLVAGQITEFQGGDMQLEVEGNWSPFALTGSSGARGAMAELSTLYPSASSQFGNPAALGDISGFSVQTDFFLPGLGLGVSSERIQLLRHGLRQPVQEMLANPDNRVQDPQYPDVTLDLYQATGISGFAVAHGKPGFTYALGMQQPFSGSLDAFAGGMKLGLGAPDPAGSPGDSVKMVLQGDAFARVRATWTDFSAAAALSPRPFWRLGLSLHRYALDMRLDAGTALEGSLENAGGRADFNGGAPGYPNRLGAYGIGRLEGYAHGFRLGSALDLGRHFGLDAMVSIHQPLRLNGGAQLEQALPPSLDLGADYRVDASRTHPQKPALTLRESMALTRFRLQLPWQAGLSFRFRSRDWRLHGDYLYSIRDLSVSFAMRDTTPAYDTATRDIRRNAAGGDSLEISGSRHAYSLKLSHLLALGLEYRQVFLYAGAQFYGGRAPWLEETGAFTPDFLPFLPALNLGYRFPLGPRFTTTVSLVAVPVSLFKTTVEYRY